MFLDNQLTSTGFLMADSPIPRRLRFENDQMDFGEIDKVFYAMLKVYQNNAAFAYNYVKTNDFRDFLSSTCRNFTEFFNDWIYGEGYPLLYQIRWTQDPTSKN